MKHFVKLLIALNITFLAMSAQALEIKQVESEKGIKAWLVEDHTLPIISLSFAFKGGIVQDPDDKHGASRLMTSLLDEGAGDLEAIAFQDRMEDLALGLSFSAGRDTYIGAARMLRAKADESFNLIRLALNEPRFDEKPLTRIRDQIVAGIKASQNNPGRLAGLAMRELVYPENHPYRRHRGGTVESMSALNVDDLRALKVRVMAQDNLLVAVVGAITEAELKERLDQVFGDLPEKADLRAFEKTPLNLGEEKVIDLPRPQVQVQFVGQGIPRDDPDFISAFIVNYVLGGSGLTSRLSNEIREKRGLAYSVGTGLSNNEYSDVFSGSVGTRTDFADSTFEVLMAELARMGESGLTQEELDLAKSYLSGAYALNFDGSRSTARALLGMQLQGRKPSYIEDRKVLIENVTLEDTKRAAKRLLGEGKYAVVRMGPVTN